MIRFRIVFFDGGGIRSLLSLILLQRLENELPGFPLRQEAMQDKGWSRC